MRSYAKDIKGYRFERLVVIKEQGRKWGQIKWLCKCDCGNEVIVVGNSLRRGTTKSCGCLRKELQSKAIKKRYKKNIETWSNWNNGRVNLKKGKKWPEVSGEKNGMFGVHRFGKDNPNYNPNLTKQDRQDRRTIKEYVEWRKSVYTRDMHICQMCGKAKTKIAAHHIAPWGVFKFLRFVTLNGITLCKNCHDSIRQKELNYAKLFFDCTVVPNLNNIKYPKQSECL